MTLYSSTSHSQHYTSAQSTVVLKLSRAGAAATGPQFYLGLDIPLNLSHLWPYLDNVFFVVTGQEQQQKDLSSIRV